MDDLDRYLYLACVVASVCALLRVAQRCLFRSSLSPERQDEALTIADIAAAPVVTRCCDRTPQEARAPRSVVADRQRPVHLTR